MAPRDDRTPFRVGVRGVFEGWADPAVTGVYRSGAFMGALTFVIPVWGPLMIDIEGGWRSVLPREAVTQDEVDFEDPRRFTVVPVSILLEAEIPVGEAPVDFGVGLGPAFTMFSESYATGTNPAAPGSAAVTGWRIGLEARAAVRLELTALTPPRKQFPSKQGGLRSIELELYGGYRFAFMKKETPGFRMSAWRAGAGLLFGF